MKIPAVLTEQLKQEFAVDVAALEASHHQTVPVSLRLNPLKPFCNFEKEGPVAWASGAFYLPQRPSFTNDPLFHAGCYYVQEASSMFVQEALQQCVNTQQKLMVLDACAAPGGKSTLLAASISKESLLVSNEVISTRVPVLVHNMVKWGNSNTVVTNNDPRDFARLQPLFDVILVDAPCSGSGLFRKQEDAVEHWSEENVKHCSLRQQRIVQDLLPALKEGGVLIYSTCSYSAAENEAVCDELVKEHVLEPLRLQLKEAWGIMETQSSEKAWGYRFFPHKVKGEGFFIACFRKKESDASLRVAQASAKKPVRPSGDEALAKITSAEQKALEAYIATEGFVFSKNGSEIIGWPSAWAEAQLALRALKIKKYPLQVGELKGKDFIPHPYLAYSPLLNAEVARTEVEEETALKYLRKQPFTLGVAQKGFELLTYQGQGLGWLKNLGNRINNYYLAEWRIIKEVF